MREIDSCSFNIFFIHLVMRILRCPMMIDMSDKSVILRPCAGASDTLRAAIGLQRTRLLTRISHDYLLTSIENGDTTPCTCLTYLGSAES